jgi:hypothetical protein
VAAARQVGGAKRVRRFASVFVVLLSTAVLVPAALAARAEAAREYRLTHGSAGVPGTVTVTGCRTTSGGDRFGGGSSTCWGDFAPRDGGDALPHRRLARGWYQRPGSRVPAAVDPAHPDQVWVAGSRVWLAPAGGAVLALLAELAIVLAGGRVRRPGARP